MFRSVIFSCELCSSFIIQIGRQKALYAWEISTDKNKARKPLQLDYGVFLPCSEFGLYTSEVMQGRDEDEINETTKVYIVIICLLFKSAIAIIYIYIYIYIS